MQCRQSSPGDLRFHPLRSCPHLNFRAHTCRRLSRAAYASAGGRDGPPAHARSLKERLDDALSGLNKALLGSSFGDELQVAAGGPETATTDGQPAEAAAAAHQSAAPAEDTDPIESWDKVYAEPDWDGKDRQPRVTGNVLFGIVVVLAAVVAGALFNTLGRHRQQRVPLGNSTPIAEVAPGGLQAEQGGRRIDARRHAGAGAARAAGSSAFGSSGTTTVAPSSTPSPSSGTTAGTAAAVNEREVAAGSFELDAHEVSAVADELSGEEEHAKHAWHEQHQPHLGGGAVSMAPQMEAAPAAAAATAWNGAGPAAAPAAAESSAPAGSDSAGAAAQGGAAPAAGSAGAGAASKAQPSGAATGDSALHRGDMHSPGGEAALARIRQLQAQHLRELEQQWGTPHPMVPQQQQQQQQQQGEGGRARMAPPAGASALAPFGSDEGWQEGGLLGQAQSQPGRTRAGSAAQSAAAAEGAQAQDDSAARWEWEAARQGLQQDEEASASEGEAGEERAFAPSTMLESDEVAPAAVPAGMTLDAVAARARVAQRAATAAAQAAHRAADASAVAAEAAHRAAQQAQHAVSAATSAQAALTLHVDDAVEESMRVVRDAEAAATRAQQEAEEAAAEAALAAARGTMSEVDAAQHARRAQQAAQLSRPYTVGEQVSAWWRTSRRAVATSAQRTQQAVTHMAQRTQQATTDAVHRAGQITSSTAQQVKQTATDTVQNVQHAAGSAGERVQDWRERVAQQAVQLWEQVGQAAANVAGNAKAAWAQLQEWVQQQFKGKGGGAGAGGAGAAGGPQGPTGPAGGSAESSAGSTAGGEASS